MYYLKRLWIWITRLTCCRGFGIQSPSAYSFVRYVVNEHYPYYAYADLADSFPQLGKRERKLGEFYFRLANFAQANQWLWPFRIGYTLMCRRAAKERPLWIWKMQTYAPSPRQNSP